MLRTKREAFTIIEMILSLSVLAIMVAGSLKLKQMYDMDKSFVEDDIFLSKMEKAIQSSFIDVLDAYAVRASTVGNFANDWGWRNSTRTSPYPRAIVAGGFTYLYYNLDSTGLTVAQRNTLRNNILGNYQGVCESDGAGLPRSDIRLYCSPKLRGLRYMAGASINLATPHVMGRPLDPINIPTVRVLYNHDHIGNTPDTAEEYRFRMDEVYQARRNISARKLNTIRDAMEGFHNRTMMREVQNRMSTTAVGGLHNMDDEFVPWIWKTFGNNSALVQNSICQKAIGGATCANFNTNNIWRTTLGGRGLLMNRMVINILAGENSFKIDGFNNPIILYPLTSQCPTATTNWRLCPVTNPTLPSDNYINTARPPHVSVLYTPSFELKATPNSDFGKIFVSY